jgi:hypothetical protein
MDVTTAVTVDTPSDTPGRQQAAAAHDVDLRLTDIHVASVKLGAPSTRSSPPVRSLATVGNGIAITVSEPCANAVEHAHGIDEYPCHRAGGRAMLRGQRH